MMRRALPRSVVFCLAAGLVLAGGLLRFQQAWSHRAVYLPAAMQEEGYYEAAVGLLSYQAFGRGVPDSRPSSWRGPIYPVFIALIESFSTEPNPGRVRLIQAALATLSIATVFVLGAAIYSPVAGLFGAALLAFNAVQIEAVTSLNIHGFYSFLILAACAALVLWSERPTEKSTVLAGAFIGFTLLCRSAHYPLVPFMAAAAWFWRPLPGPRWRAPAYFVLGVLAALAPMTARNRVVAKRWQLFPDMLAGGVALFGATTGQQGLSSYTVDPALKTAEVLEPGFKRSIPSHGGTDAAMFDLAVRRIAGAPMRFAWLCLQRLGLLARALGPPLMIGLAGLALRRRNRRLQTALIVGFSFSGYCVAGGAPEHLAAATPLLCLIAGCGGAIMLGRLTGDVAAAPADVRGWPKIILASGPVLGIVLYAAFLAALAVEARRRLWRESAPPLAREDRALSILRRGAEQGSESARRIYIESLTVNAERWVEAGDCAKAEPRLRQSLLLAPRQASAVGTMAACLVADGKVDDARALAGEFDRRPKDERAVFWNALLRRSESLGGQAALGFWAEEGLIPDDSDPKGELRGRVASHFQSTGEYDRAFVILRRLIRRYPAAGEFFSDKGICEYKKGELGAALLDLKTAIRLKPNFIPAYLSLGYIHAEKGRYAEALKVYDAGLARAVTGETSPLRGALRDAREQILLKLAAGRSFRR